MIQCFKDMLQVNQTSLALNITKIWYVKKEKCRYNMLVGSNDMRDSVVYYLLVFQESNSCTMHMDRSSAIRN